MIVVPSLLCRRGRGGVFFSFLFVGKVLTLKDFFSSGDLRVGGGSGSVCLFFFFLPGGCDRYVWNTGCGLSSQGSVIEY